MSLVSASSVIGGVKEYVYRGIQQLPIVLAATSLLFTIASGSVVHANLAAGLLFIIPLYTWALQQFIPKFLSFASGGRVTSTTWSRSTDEVCNIIKENSKLKLSIFDSTSTGSIPSYWLTSVGFFIGYAISNAVESLTMVSQPNADPINIEKRATQAIYVIVASCLFFLGVLFIRFKGSSACEGFSGTAWLLSFITSAGAAAIGYGMYCISKKCGSRASDLFGILSQILPVSSSTPDPIVCMAA